MTTKTFNAEGGSNGASVTTSDTGSGNAPDVIGLGGGTIKYATAAAQHGTLGFTITPAVGTICIARWNGFASLTGACRSYLSVTPGTPASREAIVRCCTSADVTIWTLTIDTGGHYVLLNASGGAIATSTTVTASRQRIELAWTVATSTTGQIDLYLYSADSTSPLEHLTSSSANLGTANWGYVQWGKSSSDSWVTAQGWDDIALADGTTTLFGPPNVPPSASFTDTPSGLSVTFDGTGSTATSPATITGYDWDWGDGGSHGTGATPSHTYASSGTYTVVLTVTDSNSLTGSVTHSVTVTGPVTTGSFASITTATSCTPSVGSGTSGCLTALNDGDRSTYVSMVNAAELKGAAVALVAPASGQPALAIFTAQAASAFDGTTPNVAASAVLTVKMYEGATLRGTTTVNVEMPSVGPATPPDPAVDPGSVVAAVFPWSGMAQNVTDWTNVVFDVVAALS